MKTIIVSATTLQRVAAEYLNDATQWVRIAQLNGLYNPIISGTVTLSLPTVDPTAPSGVPE
jgi:hypothetical protein